jgi:hypothetical protein
MCNNSVHISSYKRYNGVQTIRVTFHALTTATTKIIYSLLECDAIYFWVGIYQGAKENGCFLPHDLFRIYYTLKTVQQVYSKRL